MRKLVLGVATLLLPIGLLATVGASGATANASVTGSGTNNCSTLSGSLSFSPALKSGGTATTETVTVKSIATGCTGGTPAPTKILGSAKLVISKAGANDCAGLAGGSNNVTIKETYTPKVTASTFTGTATGGISATGDATFTTNGVVTGSYPSGTASSVADVGSAATIGAACGTAKGVAKLTIKSGSVTNN
jgi:hypothetical protein